METLRNQLIVIPAYQPLDSLIQLVDELFKSFKNILVIDDGGQEKYRYIFRELEEKGAIIVTHYANQGKGRALKSAINYCLLNPDICRCGIITVDADGQHKPKDIIAIADKMVDYPESVILGCRCLKSKNVPLRSRLGNGISRKVYKWVCGINVSDTQTGLRGLPFSFLEIAARCQGEKYEYETNMLLDIKERGIDIKEVEIETVYENNNESSHFDTIRDSIKIYSIIFKYSMSSIFSALVDYIVFAVSLALGSSILVATYIARACSCIINFSLNKKVVFKGKGNTAVEFIKYLILVVVSGTLSGIAVTKLSMALPSVTPIWLKIPVEIVLYIINYTVQRTLIFNKK